MKVQFNTYYINNISNLQNKNYSSNTISPRASLYNIDKPDIFVKSTDKLSFGSSDYKNKMKDVASDLKAIGFVGGTFLLSIGASCYVMDKMDPKDIFLPDGTYLMSTDDKTLDTNTIKADSETGDFKIEGTNINIEPDKYDISIPEKGIYKNNDGSVDIDLLKHKYIDAENKIFIDPEHNISAIGDENGIHNVLIPDVEHSPNFNGSSMSEGSYINHPSRSEFIAKNGYAPEDDPSLNNVSDKENMDLRRAFPDDNRTIGQKIVDFFNPLASKQPNHSFDKTKDYDIFGRPIYTITDDEGNVSKVALNEKLLDAAHKLKIDNDNISDIVKFVDNVRLKDYLIDYQPKYSNLVPEYETMDHFISRMKTSIEDSDINTQNSDGHIVHNTGEDTDIDTDSDVETHSDIISDIVDFIGDIFNSAAKEGV